MLSSANDGGDASVRDIGPRSHCCAAPEGSGLGNRPDYRHRLEGAAWGGFFCAWLALAALPATSRAQAIFTETGAMPVRIEIVAACTVSAADLDFGVYASNSPAPVQGQTTIQLLCGAGAVAELMLDAGSGLGGNTSRRSMSKDAGVSRLDYDLFQDPARTIHWGDRSGVDTLEVQSASGSQTVPVYGQIPAGQRAPDGVYGDMITVRVLF
jgi:spore coat protein U-like protein